MERVTRTKVFGLGAWPLIYAASSLACLCGVSAVYYRVQRALPPLQCVRNRMVSPFAFLICQMTCNHPQAWRSVSVGSGWGGLGCQRSITRQKIVTQFHFISALVIRLIFYASVNCPTTRAICLTMFILMILCCRLCFIFT